jgi:hypothetical protein
VYMTRPFEDCVGYIDFSLDGADELLYRQQQISERRRE